MPSSSPVSEWNGPDPLPLSIDASPCKERSGWRIAVGRLICVLGSIIFPSGYFFSSGQDPVALDIAALPPPPVAIAKLIDIGAVRFRSGDRDASQEPATGPRLAAETHYRISHTFRSHARWVLRRGVLTIRIRFKNITWDPTHTIWFRQPPPPHLFWSDSIVLHEFDHVRISADPQLAKLFSKRLNEASTIRKTVSPNGLLEGEQVNDELVDQLVTDSVERIFADVSDMIAVRYQELDRITDHGRRPLPVDAASPNGEVPNGEVPND